MIDVATEIEERINAILIKLQLLPQGPTVNFDPKARSSKPEFRPPPGARMGGGRPGGPPPRERNLYEWYSFQFARARDDHRRLFLIYLAERDYLHFVQPLPSRRVAGETLKASERWTEEREEQMRAERDGEILTLGEGMCAEEAAVFFECTWQHIRWLRQTYGCEPDTGYPREGHTPQDEARRLKREEGWSVRAIAEHLQVPKSTVQDWLSPRRNAA